MASSQETQVLMEKFKLKKHMVRTFRLISLNDGHTIPTRSHSGKKYI